MKLKIALFLSLVLFFSTTVKAQKSKNRSASEKPVKAKTDSPDASMRKFIRAIQSKDRQAFLKFFSRVKPLRVKNYQATGEEIKLIKHAELAADLKRKGELYWTYLDCDESAGLDCFTDLFTARGGKIKPWKRVGGNKYIMEKTDSEFVNGFKWRKENGQWVISEISYNTA